MTALQPGKDGLYCGCALRTCQWYLCDGVPPDAEGKDSRFYTHHDKSCCHLPGCLDHARQVCSRRWQCPRCCTVFFARRQFADHASVCFVAAAAAPVERDEELDGLEADAGAADAEARQLEEAAHAAAEAAGGDEEGEEKEEAAGGAGGAGDAGPSGGGAAGAVTAPDTQADGAGGGGAGGVSASDAATLKRKRAEEREARRAAKEAKTEAKATKAAAEAARKEAGLRKLEVLYAKTFKALMAALDKPASEPDAWRQGTWADKNLTPSALLAFYKANPHAKELLEMKMHEVMNAGDRKELNAARAAKDAAKEAALLAKQERRAERALTVVLAMRSERGHFLLGPIAALMRAGNLSRAKMEDLASCFKTPSDTWLREADDKLMAGYVQAIAAAIASSKKLQLLISDNFQTQHFGLMPGEYLNIFEFLSSVTCINIETDVLLSDLRVGPDVPPVYPPAPLDYDGFVTWMAAVLRGEEPPIVADDTWWANAISPAVLVAKEGETAAAAAARCQLPVAEFMLCNERIAKPDTVLEAGGFYLTRRARMRDFRNLPQMSLRSSRIQDTSKLLTEIIPEKFLPGDVPYAFVADLEESQHVALLQARDALHAAASANNVETFGKLIPVLNRIILLASAPFHFKKDPLTAHFAAHYFKVGQFLLDVAGTRRLGVDAFDFAFEQPGHVVTQQAPLAGGTGKALHATADVLLQSGKAEEEAHLADSDLEETADPDAAGADTLDEILEGQEVELLEEALKHSLEMQRERGAGQESGSAGEEALRAALSGGESESPAAMPDVEDSVRVLLEQMAKFKAMAKAAKIRYTRLEFACATWNVAWLEVRAEVYLPLLSAQVDIIVRGGHPKLAPSVARARPAALASQSDRFLMLRRPSEEKAVWSVEEAAIELMYQKHPQLMYLYHIMGGFDVILDTYDARHNRADYRLVLRRLPLIAALFAAYRRPTCVRWCVEDLRRLDYWFKQRPDLLRVAAIICQLANDVFAETANAERSVGSNPRTPTKRVEGALRRLSCMISLERDVADSLRVDSGAACTVTVQSMVTRAASVLTKGQTARLPGIKAFLLKVVEKLRDGSFSLGEPVDLFGAGLAALATKEPGSWVDKSKNWLLKHVTAYSSLDAEELRREKHRQEVEAAREAAEASWREEQRRPQEEAGSGAAPPGGEEWMAGV